MQKLVIAVLVLTSAITVASGAERFDPAACAKAVAPFVDDDTTFVGHADVTRIDVNAAFDHIAKVIETSATGHDDLEKLRKKIRDKLSKSRETAAKWLADFTSAGGRDIYLLVGQSATFPGIAFTLVAPVGAGADERALAGLLCSGRADGAASRPADISDPTQAKVVWEKIDGAIVAGSLATLQKFRKAAPDSQPAIAERSAEAFAAAGDSAAQVLVIRSMVNSALANLTLFTLAEELATRPTSPLAKDLRWAAVGIDAPPKHALRMVIQAHSPRAATKLRATIADLLERAAERDGEGAILGSGESVTMLTPRAVGDRLELTLDSEQLDQLLGPAALRVASLIEGGPSTGDLRVAIETNRGTIHLKLFADKTPLTCANFVNLAKRGYYDELTFHRVIKNFMIQGGCPIGNGRGTPGYRFEDEFVPELRHSKPGILSMANAGPGTNGSQFFITHKPTPHLNDRHTVFGEVVDPGDQGVVNEIVKGDRIKRVTVEGDADTLLAKMKDRVEQWNKVLDAKDAGPASGEVRALIETSKGKIRLRLFADQTPLTCANFINLAQRGYYDGLKFHRVIRNFMIQGGCPLGTGSGGPGYKFEDEFVRSLRHNKPGILSMANSGPATNGSQFFITHVPTPHLDGKHTVFGEVVDQTDQKVVNAIVKGDQILRVTIEGDLTGLETKMKDRVDQWNAILGKKFTHLRPAKW